MQCVYRGEQSANAYVENKLIKTYVCSCDNVEQSRCTLEQSSSRYAVCATCKERLESFPDIELDYSEDNWQFISAARLNADTLKLLSVIPADCRGIVGIPRSGMIPAALLSSMTQLPLFELSVQHGLRRMGQGSRTWITKVQKHPGPYFVVDDSIYSGNAITLAQAAFGDDAIFAAVYVMPEMAHLVNFYVKELPSPHFFEWNLFNNGIVGGYSMDPRLRGGIAMDLDGIICFDPPMPDADHGPLADAYARWIDCAEPRYVPRFMTIPSIITFRLEKWRDATIRWLRKYGVQWDRLVMSPHSSAVARNAKLDILGHKAQNFIDSGCSMMIESDPAQAELIHQVSQRPVLCPDAGKIYQNHCDWEALSRLNRFLSIESDSTMDGQPLPANQDQ